MINLRYHIVSITAVFLALAIGLTLGTSFLDRVTVDNLRNQLEDVEDQIRESDRTNAELRRRLDALESEAAEFDEQLSERLLAGELTRVPVLVIAPRGIDAELVDRSVRAMESAGAQMAGVWWLTDRFVLDDGDEVADLAEILELPPTALADAARTNAAARLAEVLEAAAAPRGSPTTTVPAAPTTSTPAGRTEPALAAALHEAGFIDYPGDDRVRLPAGGLRTVVIDGPGRDIDVESFLLPLLRALTVDGPASVLVAAPRPAEDASEDTPPDLVATVRETAELRDRVSSVDDLDRAVGIIASVLAIDDLGSGRTGHYGSGNGATRLLPPPEPGR